MVRESLDLLELLEELAVLEAGLGGLVGGAVEQVIAGDAEGVGEALEGVGGGLGLAVLVAADEIGAGWRPTRSATWVRSRCLRSCRSRSANPDGRRTQYPASSRAARSTRASVGRKASSSGGE